MLLRRSFLVLALVCLGCAAQSVSTELNQRIDRQVRHYYNLPPSVNLVIGSLRPSEFPGYDAVTITIQGGDKKQDYDFLLSKDDKMLIRMTRMDLSKDPYAETMKKINTSGRPIRGNKDAKVVVVNFDDFECPYCSRMHQTLFPDVLKEYGDRVEFVYKDYPLVEIHPWATHAAVDANCLAGQSSDAYWDFADYIHANQHEVSSQKDHEAQFAQLDKLTTEQGQKHNVDVVKLQSCIKAQNDDAVKASIHEGDAIGVAATPTLFVNGQELDGAISPADMRATLDRALQQAGVPAPAHPAPPAGGGPQAPGK
jgi:protein-disulfide isomerase